MATDNAILSHTKNKNPIGIFMFFDSGFNQHNKKYKCVLPI